MEGGGQGRQKQSYLELVDKHGDGVELVRGVRRVCHEERNCDRKAGERKVVEMAGRYDREGGGEEDAVRCFVWRGQKQGVARGSKRR